MWAHSGALSGRTVVPPDCCSFHPWFNAAQRGSTAPGRGLYFHVCQSSFTPACGDHKYTFMRPGEMLKEAFCPSPVWTSVAIFLIDDDGKVVKMPRRIFNLVYLGLLHLGIIPPQLHLYVMFKAIPQVFCYHGLLMRGARPEATVIWKTPSLTPWLWHGIIILHLQHRAHTCTVYSSGLRADVAEQQQVSVPALCVLLLCLFVFLHCLHPCL